MIVYHAAFDVMLFGLADWRVNADPAWRTFAAAIASSFLFLSGVSLAYAHGRPVGASPDSAGRIRWRSFLWRLAVLVVAAGTVTLGTALAMPVPIYFGILHAIALFSVLALPFRNAPPALTAVVAIAVLALPFFWRAPIFAEPWFYPVGLAPIPPIALDYEPIFPWLGATLLGVAAGRLLPRGGAIAPPALAPIAWMGRWTLAIYLIHQPVLFAIFSLVVRL